MTNSNSKTPAKNEAAAETKTAEPRKADSRDSNDLEVRMERLEAMAERQREREEALDAREAALAPRERELERNTRSRVTDDTKRKERLSLDVYRPPNQLEVPQDAEYEYRWVAEWVNGTQTPRAVQERLREGYVRVLAEDLPEDFLVDEDSFGDGYARTTGLILMRIHKDHANLRRAYYRRLSQERVTSANALQGVAGRDSVSEDRGSRSLTGAEAGQVLRQMSSS